MTSNSLFAQEVFWVIETWIFQFMIAVNIFKLFSCQTRVLFACRYTWCKIFDYLPHFHTP